MSGPSAPLPPALRALLTLGGAAALVGALWKFGRDFGYQPNDANVPLTLALAALVTVLILAWRAWERADRDEDDPEDEALDPEDSPNSKVPGPKVPGPKVPNPERNEE